MGSQSDIFPQGLVDYPLLSGAINYTTISLLLKLAVAVFILHSCSQVAYNLFFHPLRNFPGPLLGRSSLLWRMIYSMGGRFHRRIDEQHKKYGPVVRVSPNELSFANVESWKDIYGHPIAGKPTLIKSEFYEMYGAGFDSLCIGSERNPKEHARMRKSLSAAFSTKALMEQEEIVKSCVDRFVARLGADGGPGSKGLNMTKWFEMVAFDILGEMAFGESFGSVEQGHPHFWSEMITEHLFAITVVDNLRRYPFFVTLGKWILPLTASLREKHSGLSRAKVTRRISEVNPRADFCSHLIRKVNEGEMDKEELTAHASTLTIAGGETVATFMAAATFYLLKNPETLKRLQQEIRGAFSSYDEINATKAQQLPYIQAVVAEGLRMFPPGSRGFPRLSPGAQIAGHWIPKGTEVYTSAWSVTHSADYFHEPMAFKPERWMDKDCTDVKEASQPFSLGPRGCIGRNFAYVEVNLILAKMHWLYDMELINKDLDWEAESHEHVMWTKPELNVRFKLSSKAANLGMAQVLKGV